MRSPLRAAAPKKQVGVMQWERGSRSRESAIEFKSVLVPLDGSPASRRAIEVAGALAKRGKGKVYLVHVIEVERSFPLDADMGAEASRGEAILSEGERLARRLDFEVQGDLLQARDAGHAVVDEAVERGVDLIVLGVPYRRPYGEFELGTFASHILKDAPCEVLLVRLPLEE